MPAHAAAQMSAAYDVLNMTYWFVYYRDTALLCTHARLPYGSPSQLTAPPCAGTEADSIEHTVFVDPGLYIDGCFVAGALVSKA